jgi:hypothetical protein
MIPMMEQHDSGVPGVRRRRINDDVEAPVATMAVPAPEGPSLTAILAWASGTCWGLAMLAAFVALVTFDWGIKVSMSETAPSLRFGNSVCALGLAGALALIATGLGRARNCFR